MSSGHERAGGTLRITAPTAFSRLHIAPYLGSFMKKYPDLSIEIIATDHIMDIVRESIDVAIRIAEVDNSSLVARKLAPCRRVFCASPAYLKEHGTPKTLSDLTSHKVVVENNAVWRLQGPDGVVSLKLSSELKTNSSEIVHQAVGCGCGIGFLSTWRSATTSWRASLCPFCRNTVRRRALPSTLSTQTSTSYRRGSACSWNSLRQPMGLRLIGMKGSICQRGLPQRRLHKSHRLQPRFKLDPGSPSSKLLAGAARRRKPALCPLPLYPAGSGNPYRLPFLSHVWSICSGLQ